MSDAIGDRKRELRTAMRHVRRSVAEPAERSRAIWSHVVAEPSVEAACVILAFASTAGEPDTRPLVNWCRANGKRVDLPDAHPDAALPEDPSAFDVIIVPGLAFTARGDRLGQGGGWFDRLLADVRDDCTTIGVAFAEQIVDALPIDEHDVGVDVVITDLGRAWSG